MANQDQEPMIKLQPGGVAPVLSYNVPEPTSYSGRNFIDLQLHDGYFLPTKPSESNARSASDGAQRMQAAPKEPSPAELLLEKQQSGERMTTRFQKLTPEEVEQKAREGLKLNIVKTMTGALSYNFVEADPVVEKPLSAGPAVADDSIQMSAMRAIRQEEDGGVVSHMLPRDRDPIPWEPEPEPAPPVLSVSIHTPASNAVVSGPYTGATVEIRGNASVKSGYGKVGKVQVQIGTGGAYQDAALSADGSWSFQTVLRTPGPIHITARATHATEPVSASARIAVTVSLAPQPDTTVPTVRITSPSAGALLNTRGGPAAQLNVEGTASDDRGVARVEVIVDQGAAQLAESLNGFANWKRTVSLGAGSHTILVKAYDAANNVGTASLTVFVDAAPPTVSITSPLNNAEAAGTHSQGAIIEVLGTASDAGGIDYVELSLDMNPIGIRAAEKAPGDWSQWKGVLTVHETGKHTITARAYDRSNNMTETTIAVNVTVLPEVNSRLKRLILVESYRMSSYLANYGAGRTIKTFSLLPGEKSKISIRSYRENETTAKSAATILDSVTDDIAEEFENSIAKEQADQKSYKESNEYKIEGEAGVSWGWGSAKISAGVSGGTNAAREQFAKNVVNNTQKHVAKASARRDVQINTTYEEKNTTTDETTIVREIENINVSRTLNFVFRQMNQEFITLLHLVDVRIGYFTIDTINGEEKKQYREVTLPQLDALLEEVIVPEKRAEVRNAILYQLMNIFDYQDRHHSFVEEEPFKDRDGNVIPLSHYLRVKKDYTSTYRDDATGTTIEVPGIILAATRHILRTDGIVVEALLGQGEALDHYSRSLQLQAIREKDLRNDLLEAEVRMKRLALKILGEKDAEAAQLYAMLNPPPAAAKEDSDHAAPAAEQTLAEVR
ncbi:Ig-like domain-containing protein [Paenibacillus sp.]|uniref:Ig-like domain-containing protein n=1 Tax=Paenibacillus sp. TaxID=58172 RepID=UPI002D642BAF|nr:Ig-like domain-containing protein [Paenibacillus sp.]HZG88107.1 Ig-like domain-containing protein [Paenibacillus sp.]